MSYVNAAAAVTVNLALAGPQNTVGAGIDTLVSIENLTGSNFNDVLTSNGNANVLIGGAGDDTLDAGGGNDMLFGNAGNDTLTGGTGDDGIDGGADTDTASYAAAASGVTVNLATAAAQNTVGAGTDTLTSIENLIGSASGDTLTGNGGDNGIRGGAGNDVLDGAGGNDTASYANEAAAVTVDLSLSTPQNTAGSGTDTLTGFENLEGSTHNDVLTGNTGDNVLVGSAGDDTLNAGAGNDTLIGDPGNDLLVGGAGNDFIGGGSDTDTASYFDAPGAVTVSLAISGAQNTGAAGTDTLSGIENLIGSNFNDALTGNAGDNALDGGAGDDTLEGGAGNDNLAGGADNDTATYAGAAAGVTVSLATAAAQNTVGAGTDTLATIEHLTGSAFNDSLTGNGGDNVIVGAAGDDALFGGAGNNTLNGGAGNDALDGGADTDTVTYADAAAAVTVSLATAIAQNTGGSGTDALAAIENLTGSAFNDVLTGASGNNLLNGGDGDHTLEGGDGNDTLDGGSNADTASYAGAAAAVSVNLDLGTASGTATGTDTLIDIENARGSAGGDVLTGSDTANTLEGLGGNDILDGGAGNDELNGGLGDDTYIYRRGDGDDTIVDESGTDTLEVDSNVSLSSAVRNGDDLVLGFFAEDGHVTDENHYAGSSIERIVFAQSLFPDGTPFDLAINDTFTGTVGAGDHDELFVGTDDNDTIDGGDGHDFIFGNGGNDMLIGGIGDDVLTGGAGNDHLIGGPDGGPFNNADVATYITSSAGVTVDLFAGTGIGGDAEGDELDGIEGVIGSQFADVLYGGLDDGFETFRGNDGADYIDGRAGLDRADYRNDPAAVTVYLIDDYAIDGWGNTDTLLNIEEVVGSSFNDSLTGTENEGKFERFRGRAGDDAIDGSLGFDEADYNDSPTAIYVFLNNIGGGYAFDGWGGTDGLYSIEGIRGSAFADTIVGADFRSENFRPLLGADIVDGGGGTEDSIDYRQDVFFGGTGAVTVDLDAGFGIDGGGYTDTLSNIEGAFGTALGDTLSGSNGSQFEFFNGGAGNDIIDGRGGLFDQVNYDDAPGAVSVYLDLGTTYAGVAGTDTLTNIEYAAGSQFDDKLIGDAGDNRLRGLGGNDLLDGGAGIDEADYAFITGNTYATVGVSVDLSIFGPQNTVGAGTDTLIGIERLRGSMGDDSLTGDFNDNRIRGLAGNDTLDGGFGTSDLVDYSQDGQFGATHGVTVDLADGSTSTDGFGDTDTLYGFEIVYGTEFNDVLTGRNSLTVLEAFRGGAGNDVINGGGVGDATDEARYNDAPVGVTVNLGAATLGLLAGQALDGFGGTDMLTSIESVVGSQSADYLIGGDPNSNNFEKFRGLGGNDHIDGRSGFDEVDYSRLADGSYAFGSVTVDLGAGSATGTEVGTDALFNIESIRASMGDDLLTGNGGDNRFRGLGGADTIDGGLGNDTVDYSRDVDSGGYNGVIVSLTDNYALDGFGKTDTLTSIEFARGTESSDALQGSSLVNQLFGLGGDDSLAGFAGADLLDGGAGERDAVSYGVDATHGGLLGVSVDLGAGFAVDGFGATDTLSGFEIVIGTAFNDTLLGTGTVVQEFFAPGLGNDYVDGDIIGTNEVWYNDVAVGVTVDLSITSAQNTIGAGTDTLLNIQNVRGTMSGDVLAGNSGTNVFYGLAGADHFDGGSGGSDWLDYSLDAQFGGANGVYVHLDDGVAVDGFGATDTLINIFNVRGTDFDDVLNGRSAANILEGGGGNDVIWGSNGADTLDGGAGFDTVVYGMDDGLGGLAGVSVDLAAGVGSDGWGNVDSLANFEAISATHFGDTLRGSDNPGVIESFRPNLGTDIVEGRGGIDVVDYRNGVGGVTVDLDEGFAIDWGGSTDTLLTIENVIGSDFNDTLLGDDFDNVLRGLGGNDIIDGGTGVIIGEDYGFDTADYAFLSNSTFATNAVTVDLGTGSATGLDIGTDTLAHIDAVRGTMGADVLTGNGEDNVFIGLDGADIIEGGGGIDTVDYSTDASFGGFSGVSVDLTADGPNASDAFGATDTLNGIESVIGTDSADTITSGAEINAFDGRGGDDVLTGGAGNDTLTGGWGADTFVFGPSFGDDVITDFSAGLGIEDRIDLSALALSSGFDDLQLQQVGANTVITSAAFAGNTITLTNVDAIKLHPDDFVF